MGGWLSMGLLCRNDSLHSLAMHKEIWYDARMIKRYFAMMALACVAQVQAAVSEIAHSAVEAARSYGAAVRTCDMGWALDYMYPPLKMTYAEQFANRSGQERENARRVMGLTEEKPEEARARTQAGLKALREHYVRMGKQMQQSGLKIESFVVKEPTAEYVVTSGTTIVNENWGDGNAAQGQRERSRLVVLPTVLVVSGPSPQGGVTRVERRSHIYAIRDEVVRGTVDRNGLTQRGTKINKWYFVDGNTDVNTLRAFFPNLPLKLALPDGGERVIR